MVNLSKKVNLSKNVNGEHFVGSRATNARFDLKFARA